MRTGIPEMSFHIDTADARQEHYGISVYRKTSIQSVLQRNKFLISQR